MTKTLLDKLRNNEVYDLIFIDENMEKINARSFLMKCKKIDNFKGKIYVLSQNKELNNKKEILSLKSSGIIYSPIVKKDLENLE